MGWGSAVDTSEIHLRRCGRAVRSFRRNHPDGEPLLADMLGGRRIRIDGRRQLFIDLYHSGRDYISGEIHERLRIVIVGARRRQLSRAAFSRFVFFKFYFSYVFGSSR